MKKVLKNAMKTTDPNATKDTIEIALKESVDRKKREGLISLIGTMDFNFSLKDLKRIRVK